MKHAFLIMAHTNYPLLSRIIKKLDHRDHAVFIHIDAKSPFTDQDAALLKNSCRFCSVHLIERSEITWGGYCQINLELRLLEAAVKEGFDYYHLLSGCDFPTKSMEDLHRFFQEHNGCEFVSFSSEEFLHRIRGRFAQFHFFSEKCGRDRKNPLFWINKASVLLQKHLLRVDRTRKHPQIQFKCGANWFSITHGFAEYLLEREPLIRELFVHTSCADEVFLQTILYSSPFMENVYGVKYSVTGTDACLRSIDWGRPGKVAFSPYEYTVEDYEALIRSGNLFCRKVSDQTPEGESLIQKLEMIGSQDA